MKNQKAAWVKCNEEQKIIKPKVLCACVVEKNKSKCMRACVWWIYKKTEENK